MSDSQWVRIGVGTGNWLRFDPLTDEDMAAVIERLDTDYGRADLAGRYAYAWLDVARLISTLAAVQSLAAMQDSAQPEAQPAEAEARQPRTVAEVLDSIEHEARALGAINDELYQRLRECEAAAGSRHQIEAERQRQADANEPEVGP